MADQGQDSPMPDRSADEPESEDASRWEQPTTANSANNQENEVSTHSSHSNSNRTSPARNDDGWVTADSSESSGGVTATSTSDTNHSSSSAQSSRQPSTSDVAGWFPISEDSSVASPSEIAHLESLGEFSALDEDHWTGKFTRLRDPEYVVDGFGTVQFTMQPFNGTLQNPRREYVYVSPPVRIAGHLFRLKLFPKGLDGPYLAVNLECRKERKGQESCPPVWPEDEEVKPSDESILPWRLPAQFEILVYNPQEPRVHFRMGSSQSFSAKTPCCSFKRFASVNIMDIGMRMAHQRQALLRNDTLAIVAYIRTFRDDTGCLFLRPSDSWDSLSISGFRGIDWSRDGSRSAHGSSLLAAVTTWLYLPPLQRVLAAAKAIRDATTNPAHIPLILAFSEMHNNMKQADASSKNVTELDEIEAALSWHAAIIPDDAEVFEVWELLRGVLLEELKTLPSPEPRNDLLLLGPPRVVASPDPTRAIKDVQGLLTCKFSEKVVSTEQSTETDGSTPARKPRVLYVQLPRQRFDYAKRRWKKSKKPYELTERLTEPGPFKLHAILTHDDGDLKSRSFSTIIRADGENFYKYGPNYRHVLRLTRQQALVDSQVTAYGAVYLLEEDGNERPTPQMISGLKMAEAAQQTDFDAEKAETVAKTPTSFPLRLTFLDSRNFESKECPGCLDQYGAICDRDLRVTVENAEDLQKLSKTVENFFLSKEDDNKVCYVWQLYHSYSRFCPEILPADLVPENFDIQPSEPGLFWVHVAERGQTGSGQPSSILETRSENSKDEHENRAESGGQEKTDASKVECVQNLDTSGDTAMTDAIMDSESSKILTLDPESCYESYVFVKYFDPEAQSLKGLCNYIENQQRPALASIREHAPSLFEAEREYLFFEEVDPNFEPSYGQFYVHPVGQDTKLCASNMDIWRIFIIQPTLTPAQKDQIALNGGVANLKEFLAHVYRQYSSPSIILTNGQVSSRSYFGSSWYEGSFSRCKPHGEGKEITMSGEEYSGGFKMGLRNGKGVLRQPNNNTYEGDFWNGEPHGNGKHVDALTGNTYTGGFQRGRKRGRGTTVWNQAEEEVKVCRICYESEQDCAFYPCGHVCACLECAKMASNCPMCHREGSRPFRLFFSS